MSMLFVAVATVVLVVSVDVVVRVDVEAVARVAKGAGVEYARLVSGVLVAVAVAVVVVVCVCKFVNVSIKGRGDVRRHRHLRSFFLPSSSSSKVAVPPATGLFHESSGVLGLAVACGCALPLGVAGMPCCCRVLS
jgi:hypothetical protein